jgi:hypothetical protein
VFFSTQSCFCHHWLLPRKSEILSDAVASYTASKPDLTTTPVFENPTVNSDNEPASTAASADADSIPDGFRLDQKSCSKRAETIACDLLIPNPDCLPPGLL